ncbi:MAG: uncharacterized protein A8A55_1863 [Amphiamblys sp. WSBS2006]|nr:MAG: uncharacterized protein A8A55_1863 [Amphiamblys sp. WSBS2006]
MDVFLMGYEAIKRRVGGDGERERVRYVCEEITRRETKGERRTELLGVLDELSQRCPEIVSERVSELLQVYRALRDDSDRARAADQRTICDILCNILSAKNPARDEAVEETVSGGGVELLVSELVKEGEPRLFCVLKEIGERKGDALAKAVLSIPGSVSVVVGGLRTQSRETQESVVDILQSLCVSSADIQRMAVFSEGLEALFERMFLGGGCAGDGVSRKCLSVVCVLLEHNSGNQRYFREVIGGRCVAVLLEEIQERMKGYEKDEGTSDVVFEATVCSLESVLRLFRSLMSGEGKVYFQRLFYAECLSAFGFLFKKNILRGRVLETLADVLGGNSENSEAFWKDSFFDGLMESVSSGDIGCFCVIEACVLGSRQIQNGEMQRVRERSSFLLPECIFASGGALCCVFSALLYDNGQCKSLACDIWIEPGDVPTGRGFGKDTEKGEPLAGESRRERLLFCVFERCVAEGERFPFLCLLAVWVSGCRECAELCVSRGDALLRVLEKTEGREEHVLILCVAGWCAAISPEFRLCLEEKTGLQVLKSVFSSFLSDSEKHAGVFAFQSVRAGVVKSVSDLLCMDVFLAQTNKIGMEGVCAEDSKEQRDGYNEDAGREAESRYAVLLEKKEEDIGILREQRDELQKQAEFLARERDAYREQVESLEKENEALLTELSTFASIDSRRACSRPCMHCD